MSETTEQAALWPGGALAVPQVPAATRPESLSGKTVAFVWDHMFRGEEIFPVLQDELSARYPGVRFVGYEAFGSTFGGDEHAVLQALPQRLAEHKVDAAISGVGC